MTFVEALWARREGSTVEDGPHAVPWDELLGRADAFARRLEPRSVVALDLGRSLEWVVALLGVWRADATALLLSNELPRDRRSEAAARTRARVAVGPGLEVTTLDPRGAPPPEGAAYAVFTSGSTGRPKGVWIGWSGLGPMLAAQVARFGIEASSRTSWWLSPAFDASISDVGTALTAGATLVVSRLAPTPTSVTSLTRAAGLTHADLPPVLLARWGARELPALATVIVGGEPLAAAAAGRWAPGRDLHSVYGPTEATVCTHSLRVDDGFRHGMLGSPLPGVQERVVDGELLLGGPQLALGYVDDDALDRARFVVDGGLRWYRTGDRVTGAVGGALVFLGRTDRQHKVRGQLVCEEEVEAALGSAGATEARVEVRGDEITAWLAGDVDRVRAKVVETLPAWCVPTRWRSVEALPRGAAGKPSSPAPPTPREARLGGIAREVVGHAVPLDEPLDELGVDSLALLEILACAGAEGLDLARRGLVPGTSLRAWAAATSRAWTLDELERDVAALRREVPRRAFEGGRVCVTGATGHLGRFVLDALLEAGVEEPWCLVRDPSALAGLPVRRIVGAIDRPRWGLDRKAWREVSDDVGTVVHLAADTSLAASYEASRPTNVASLAALLDLAATGRPKRIHHASSLAVWAASTPRPPVCPEASLHGPRAWAGGYAAGKAAAERVLDGVPGVTQHRFGLLVGDHEQGRPSPTCQLAAMLRRFAGTDALPEGSLDLTPVDAAARAMVRLVTSGVEAAYVHVAQRDPTPFTAFAPALRASTGAGKRAVDDALTHLGLLRGPEDLWIATGTRFEVSAAAAWIPPVDEAFLERLVRGALA